VLICCDGVCTAGLSSRSDSGLSSGPWSAWNSGASSANHSPDNDGRGGACSNSPVDNFMQFDDDEDFADDDVDMEVVASSFCACNDA